MKRKRLVLILALPIVLFLAAFLVIPLLVDAESLKERALAEIRQRTGYAVTAGKASLQMRLSDIGIAIESVALASPDSSHTASAKRVVCSVRLWPLLKKRVELRRILLEEPEVALRPAERRDPKQQGSPALALFVVESWEVKNGRFLQRGPSSELRIEGIDAKGGFRWTPERPSEGSFSGTTHGGSASGKAGTFALPPLEAEAAFLMSATGDSVWIPDALVASGPFRAELSGAWGASHAGWGGALEGQSDPFSIEDVLSQIPQWNAAPFSLTGQAALESFRIETDASADTTIVSGRALLSGITVSRREGPPILTRAEGAVTFSGASAQLRNVSLRWDGLQVDKAKADLAWDGNAVTISNIQASVNGGSAGGSIRAVKEEREWTATSQVDVSGVDVAPFSKTWLHEGVLRGLLDAKLSLTGPPARPDVDLVATLKGGAFENLDAVRSIGAALGIDAAAAERWPFRDLRGRLRMRAGEFLVDSLRCEVAELTCSIQGTVSRTGGLSLGGILSADPLLVELPPAVQALAQFVQNAEGRVPIDFSLKGTLQSPEVLLDWEGFAERAARTAADKEAETIEDALEEKIKDPETLEKLRKILRGKKP